MKNVVLLHGLMMISILFCGPIGASSNAAPGRPNIARLAKQADEQKQRQWVALSVAIADGKLGEVQRLVPSRIGKIELNDAGLTPLEMAENVQDGMDAVVDYLRKGPRPALVEPAEWSANYQEVDDALERFAKLTLEGDRGRAQGPLDRAIRKVILLGMPWDNARDATIDIEISAAQVQKLRHKLSRIRKEIGPQQQVVERKLELLEAGLKGPESVSPEIVRPKPRRMATKKDWDDLEGYIRTGYLTGVRRLVPGVIASADKMPSGKTVLEAAQLRQQQGRKVVDYLSQWGSKHAEIAVIMDKILYPKLRNNSIDESEEAIARRINGVKEAVARVNDYIEQIEDAGGNLQAKDANGKTLLQRIQVIVKAVGTIPNELSEGMKEIISKLTPAEMVAF